MAIFMLRLALVVVATGLAGCDQFKDAKDAVSREMLDPGSAQFRDMRRCSGDREVIGGEVNAKNGFGAYTGFKPFYFADGEVVHLDDDRFSALTDRCFSDLNRTASSAPATAATPSPTTTATIRSRKPKPNADVGEPMDWMTPEEQAEADAIVEAKSQPAADRCWQSYCPCDTKDPDYGGVDKILCDRIKGGLPVEDELMSVGSGGREARRQLREFEREHGSF